MRRSLVIVAALFLIAAATSARAQQGTAEIGGKVTDEQGAVLPGVAIVVTNEDTGVFREVVSGPDGSYFVSQLVPGRYRILAKLEGFRTSERRDLILRVGNTLTINLTLGVGTIEETVTVTGETPLVDLTSAEVGGTVTGGEVTELPVPNRNYMAMIALLPGIQYSPSNQMGNDTIAASGQATQGNNVTIDGGYNADDSLGTSAGAQTRVALESIQEFQVLTNQYDAEFGRASGAVINAVTKQGTNEFKGVAFGYYINSNLTTSDFLTRQANLPKPEASKREFGGVFGGPIVRNKAHFFFSVEKVLEKPNRAFIYPTRPEFSFSTTENRSMFNTVVRVDHQVNATNSWAFRWLRESAPQIPIIATRQTPETFGDETDLDQTLVGTYTTVLGNSRVNTFRGSATLEHWEHYTVCTRANGGDQAACPPTLDYLSFIAQQNSNANGPRDRNWQVEDTFSWFVPNKKGTHDLKFGGRYHYTELERFIKNNLNGTFFFNTDLPFDPANPRTYPERFSIRVPADFNLFMRSHTLEAFLQDKWHVNPRLTLSLGVRYDLEKIPIPEVDNPLFADPNDSPVDRNNLSPRLGFSYALDDDGKSVVRGGYGIFYDRTILGTIDDFFDERKFATSFDVAFPQNTVDPGPSRGQFPTDPMLVNGPVINRALLNALYPPGATVRNRGIVTFDSPDRKQPYAHQITFGYERQLTPTIAVSADYVRMRNKDKFLARNLNPMVRANTTRTGAITRVDAFGVLGEPYFERVWLIENRGENAYDALNVQLEKRYANRWSGRLAYALSSSRGTANAQGDENQLQVLDDLNLDELWGPSPVNRRHLLTLSGRMEVPKTGGATLSATTRYMSGSPFTISDSSIDANRNGEFFDPLPAGTYSGTAPNSMKDVKNDGGPNGAVGPDYFQVDLRAGWRARLGGPRTLEVFADVFNVTNRANFNNPSGDRRVASTFLVLRTLRGGSGFPRQAQFGARLAF